MAQDEVKKVEQHLKESLELTHGQRELGLNDFLSNLALAFKITFETARSWLYKALDARKVVLTPSYTVRIAE